MLPSFPSAAPNRRTFWTLLLKTTSPMLTWPSAINTCAEPSSSALSSRLQWQRLRQPLAAHRFVAALHAQDRGPPPRAVVPVAVTRSCAAPVRGFVVHLV